MTLMADPLPTENVHREEAATAEGLTRPRTAQVMEVLIDLEGFRYAQDAGVSFRVTTCCTAPVAQWMGSAVCGSCLGRVPEVVLAAPRLR